MNRITASEARSLAGKHIRRRNLREIEQLKYKIFDVVREACRDGLMSVSYCVKGTNNEVVNKVCNELALFGYKIKRTMSQNNRTSYITLYWK